MLDCAWLHVRAQCGSSPSDPCATLQHALAEYPRPATTFVVLAGSEHVIAGGSSSDGGDGGAADEAPLEVCLPVLLGCRLVIGSLLACTTGGCHHF